MHEHHACMHIFAKGLVHVPLVPHAGRLTAWTAAGRCTGSRCSFQLRCVKLACGGDCTLAVGTCWCCTLSPQGTDAQVHRGRFHHVHGWVDAENHTAQTLWRFLLDELQDACVDMLKERVRGRTPSN
jgi:hypothetical protein